jgi:quinol monooxygenase YgiN
MTSNDTVVVVASVGAAEGNDEKVEQALRTAVQTVHAEPGRESYAFHRALGSRRRSFMIEKWASAEALDTHAKAPALATFVAALGGLLAKPLDIQTLTALPDGDDRIGRL